MSGMKTRVRSCFLSSGSMMLIGKKTILGNSNNPDHSIWMCSPKSVLWCGESFRYSLNEAWWFSTFFLQIATCHMLGVYFLYRDPFLRWKVLGTSGLQKLENHQCGYSLLHLYFRGVSIKDRPKPREGFSSSDALREYERSLFCTLNRFRAWAQLGLLILGTD